jgi:lipopolysaccharide transport system permease protein
MFGLFMGFLGSARQTLTAAGEMVMQVNYPHEALLFKQTANQLARFIITFALNIVVLLLFRVVPSWGILFFPLVALPMFFLGAAVGLILSMVGIVAVDITRVVDFGLGFLMFLTPVIYADDVASPLIQAVIKWNPLTYLVCSCRDIILYGRLYQPLGYAVCALGSLLAFLLAWRMFYVSEDRVIERMI